MRRISWIGVWSIPNVRLALVLMTFLGRAKPYTRFESRKSRSALQWWRSWCWSSHWVLVSCCGFRYMVWRGRGERERLWLRWRLLDVLVLGGLLDRPCVVRALWDAGWRWLRCMAGNQWKKQSTSLLLVQNCRWQGKCIRVLGLALCHGRKGSRLSLVPYGEMGAHDLFWIQWCAVQHL